MRASAIVVLAVGLVVAAVMVVLGLWQMQVFLNQGNTEARERAEGKPVPIGSVVGDDNTVSDGYGRPVSFTGTYLPSQQVIARDADGSQRVVAAVELSDGRVLPVVLGVMKADDPPSAPSGPVTATGVLLASDGVPDPAPSLGEGEIDGVRLSALAQVWSQQLLPGYVTLDAAGSRALGLQPASLDLPAGDGSLRNEGYALQWWVFAVFAIVIAIKVARDLQRGQPTAGNSGEVAPSAATAPQSSGHRDSTDR